MHPATVRVDLGFTAVELPAGTHICQVYTDDSERESSLNEYLLRGLQTHERCACFSDKTSAIEVGGYLDARGVASGDALATGALLVSGAREVYFAGDRFDPGRMLALLQGFYEASKAQGFRAARVIGEMDAAVNQVAGGSRLMEYESQVNSLVRNCPLSAVCQYDARAFDGATIMDVLSVHPMMLIRGAVVHNPFFVPPEVLLG